jgi:osmoprotectant transport system permease protein
MRWWPILALALTGCDRGPGIVVASKQDAETTILGEMASQVCRASGAAVEFKQGWGGTPAVWEALRVGAVDVYPEYTGTIALQILHDPALVDLAALRFALAPQEIGLTNPLGFANNYALGMRADRAAELHLQTASDLRGRPKLRLRFSSEFMGRSDGWPELRQKYDLPQTDVAGMDHQLAYRALSAGEADVTDLYTTDAEIRTRRLTVLTDDLHFFPQYQAVFVYRLDLERRAPAALKAIRQLEGRLDREAMIGLNERAKSGEPPAQVAASFLQSLGLGGGDAGVSRLARFWKQTREHVVMVSTSLLFAVIVALPLGICAARRPWLERMVLGIAGVVQTIPALALLALLIPFLGLLKGVPATGVVPAMIALFLYSLLPIIRNTVVGLRGIPANLREAAEGLGLPPAARLWRIELPLAAPAILAGVRTAAVISVGTATLGALIGAGGYGQSITQGVQLNDAGLILEGAIPAAVMALAVDGLFGLLERIVVPKGLRLATQN